MKWSSWIREKIKKTDTLKNRREALEVLEALEAVLLKSGLRKYFFLVDVNFFFFLFLPVIPAQTTSKTSTIQKMLLYYL